MREEEEHDDGSGHDDGGCNGRRVGGHGVDTTASSVGRVTGRGRDGCEFMLASFGIARRWIRAYEAKDAYADVSIKHEWYVVAYIL